ncbi:MAG TPA: TlpA disulfide reductase family protein [Myxococcaceae bacterium]|nr:TlpA disulfide reductase family protein [Myxococcaceae bacterium]
MSPRLLLPSLLSLLLLVSGCKNEPPPSYLRLDGAAPPLANIPKARALLVVFWAAWCPPCREETPGLLALAEEPPEGLQVVVFSHDPNQGEVEAFLGSPPSPALHLRLDEEERAARTFGVDRLPTSILVVEGRLVARFNGARDWDSRAMRRLLEKLTREQPPGADSGAH